MTQAIAQNINNVFKYKERIFTFLVTGIIISGFAYVYLLHSAISDVVARASSVRQNRALSTVVSELEAKYFQVKDTINIELAHSKGFKDAEAASYISPSAKSLTAMVNNHEL